MRQMRFLALGIVSFVVAIVGTLLAPGTFVNRAFSAALCTLFSFNWTVCTVDLGGNSQRVVAANLPAVVADISNYLQAQRDPSEFGDEPSAPLPQQSNPQAPPFPQDPGPNFPVRREFDRSVQNGVSREQFTVVSNLRQIGSGLYEIVLRSPEGCQITRKIRTAGKTSFYESIQYTAPNNNACGGKSYEFQFSPNGSRIEAQSSLNEKFIVEVVNPVLVRTKYIDSQGREWLFESEQINSSSKVQSFPSRNVSISALSIEPRTKELVALIDPRQSVGCSICENLTGIDKSIEFGRALDDALDLGQSIGPGMVKKWKTRLINRPSNLGDVIDATGETLSEPVREARKSWIEDQILNPLQDFLKKLLAYALECDAARLGECEGNRIGDELGREIRDDNRRPESPQPDQPKPYQPSPRDGNNDSYCIPLNGEGSHLYRTPRGIMTGCEINK